jgi:hypothetical protein
MNSLSDTLENVKETVQSAGSRLEHKAAVQAGKAVARQQARTADLLASQDKELKAIRRELEDVRKKMSSGGFPWGLLLLAGGAYFLYRRNAGVREQVDGLLQRINPGIEGNLVRAKDAVKDAASDLSRGDSPRDALDRLGGEVQRAGEKTVDHLRDTAGDLKKDAQAKVDEVRKSTDRPAEPH